MDLGTGLVDPADGAFTLSTNVPAGEADANASTGVRSICNAAGNCRAAGPISGIQIDRVPPLLRVTLDPPAGPYPRGTTVQVGFSCTDTASGIGSCPSATTLDTTSPGLHTATFSAVDEAGNVTSTAVPYTVQAIGIAPMIVTPDPRGEIG